jgi:hypothetical protein
MAEEYYSVLARTISAASDDHARLREMVYRLARIELKKELDRRFEIELQKQTSALEDAIDKIESDFADMKALPEFASQSELDRSDEAELQANTAITVWQGPDQLEASERSESDYEGHSNNVDYELLAPIVQPSPYPDWLQPKGGPANHFPSPPKLSNFWWVVQLAAAAVVGLAIFFVGEMRGEFGKMSERNGHVENLISAQDMPQTDRAVTNTIEPHRAQSKIDGAPLPTSYGVYAVDRGKLVALQPLPIRVPDPRIAISALISKPSLMTLPDGHASFVVFRRDLLNNAPDHATVRVVARIMRALTFKAGEPAQTADIEGKWAVRSKSYGMSVSPVPGNPEMIVIRPAQPQISLPAGRYALVVNRDGYDFTVAGPIADVAQCLERTDAVDRSVYSECRKL